MLKATILASVGVLSMATTAQAAGTVSFTDNFNAGASAQWSNQTGNWSASGGSYHTTAGTNSPTTYSALPYDLTNFSLTFDALSIGDSGVYLRSDGLNGSNAVNNGLLLVIGGDGNGANNSNGGRSLYFHTITGSAFSGEMDRVTPFSLIGENHSINVTAIGNLFNVYVDGSSSPVTSFDATGLGLTHGKIGLYGYNNGSSFDNVNLTGTLFASTSSVPEPATWTMMLVGFGIVGFAMRKRSNARTTVSYA